MRTLLWCLGLLVGCKDGVEVVADARTRDLGAGDAGGDAAADAARPVDEGTVDVGVLADAAGDAEPDGALADSALDAAIADAVAPPDAGADAAADAGIPGVADPGQAGPFGVLESEVAIPLAAPRSVMARVFRPEADGPRPLVLFMHGFQLSGAAYASTGRHLASHGFVVVLPTMGDGLLNPLTHRQLADDVRAMLDHLVRLPEVDAARIGAAGHSRGGKQVILAALLDDRIRAVFGVDPVDSAPPLGGNPQDFPSVAPEMMGEFGQPLAVIGAGLAGMAAFPGAPACAPVEDNHRVYFESTGGPAWSYTLPQAGHLDFADDCGLLCLACTPGGDPAATRAFTRRTLVAFFQWQLVGNAGFRPWVEGPPVVDDDGIGFERRPVDP